MKLRMLLSGLLIALATIAPAAPPELVAQAEKIVPKEPTPQRWLALAEIKRSAGLPLADELAHIGTDTAQREWLAWRLLPVGPAHVSTFRQQVELLRLQGNPWLGVYDLYLAALEQDRPALLALARRADVPLPTAFPNVGAEQAHRQLLEEVGLPRSQAGLRVIRARSHDALHALRGLDQTLTREAAFLRTTGNVDDAAVLTACRDRLRGAYLAAGQQLVERLFALTLLGQTAERDALRAKAQTLPYLNDPQALARLLGQLDEERAWAELVEPLLTSEVRFLAAPPALARPTPALADLHIQSVSKTGAEYAGKVQARLGGWEMRCERLSVVYTEGQAAAQLAGAGAVTVRGLTPGQRISADRFTFSTDTGSFTFGGDVRLEAGDDVRRLRVCTVGRGGAVRDARSLLDDFRDAGDEAQRVQLLPAISRVYRDDELPADVRLLLALHILRPHLTWHAPYAPPREGRAVEDRDERRRDELDDYRWEPALGGPGWLRPAGTAENAFWRIADPRHADVARAIRLLDGIKTEDAALRSAAWRWLEEVRRNNTVVTFDVPGGFTSGADGAVVMDVRNAERVAFTLYHVRTAADLLWLTDRIGTDFIFREHDLREQALERVAQMESAKRALAARQARTRPQPPAFTAKDVVAQWSSDVASLRALGQNWHGDRDHWRDDYDGEATYYDDACEQFRARLQKDYRPHGQRSSWQCDRVVPLPGKALATAGAYVLVGTANGQLSYAPIIVDPLSLTLRRCRDGVFALVSDHTATQPAAGATVQAREMLGQSVADGAGAAFVRVFAAGDRAFVAQHAGRFAIGGFGRVFEGVYRSPDDEPDFLRSQRARRLEQRVESASVYVDRHVVAAYTDRPTYRPGQEVQFKLIVRQLGAADEHGPPAPGFRLEDFELASRLTIPPTTAPLRYAILDPKGRAVADGELRLNDHGTAAAKLQLNAEAGTGRYALRVHLAGEARIVPDVFAVQYYRRPNFEVRLAGVPARVKPDTTLKIKLAGEYYFGKPVVGGKFDVRLVRPEGRRPLAEAEGTLDAAGNQAVELEVPANVSGGACLVIASVTDGSGRTVSKSQSLEIDGPAARRDGLAAVPRFLRVNEAYQVATSAAQVTAELRRAEPTIPTVFPARDGMAEVKLAAPGWHILSAGKETTDVFVYGGTQHPLQFDAPERGGWVDLAEYTSEEESEPELFGRTEPLPRLLALFDRQQAAVGDRLRVLVHAPCRRARLLFTLEGATVVDYFVTMTPDEPGHYHVIDIPIRKRHLPNFYLQGRIVAAQGPVKVPDVAAKGREQRARRDLDEGENPLWCRIDVTDPHAVPAAEQLRVQVQPDAAEYRPGGTVAVRIGVTDRQGQPRAAEVSLGAVDESVFTFGEERVGWLAQLFADPHPERRYAVKTWRVSLGQRPARPDHRVAMQRLAEMAKSAAAMDAAQQSLALLTPLPDTIAPARLGGQLPVGAIPLGRLRTDFRETATWQPQLRAGADGVVRTTFTLPDSLTQYRLTAVALTKDSEIGTGTARLRATLPLAAQLFLPRFAVEKDRLLAVGLVHNNGTRDRTCTVAWDVADAQVSGLGDEFKATVADWKLNVVGNRTTGQGRLTVPAGQSRPVGVWLLLDRVAEVKITFRCTDGTDADAEERALPVQPLGREREVAMQGSFADTKALQLPAGFVARELRINLAQSDIGGALDGLGYLVDYPYGCVEQTMSRFLPAVVVKAATRQAPIPLADDVAARLPDVLARGLARLYYFQHADGGWGWWEKDATDPAMTIYVVNGLARCQLAGTAVNADVLARGCNYLKQQLNAGRLDELKAARAWLALALAGQADAEALAAAGARALEKAQLPEAKLTLALACRAAGRMETAQRLWKAVQSWTPDDTEALALALTAQLQFGAPYLDCHASASRLLARRTGARWEHTRATAGAIDALAAMLVYAVAERPARKLTVTVGDRVVLEVVDPAELKKLVHRVHLPPGQAPGGEGLKIALRVEGEAAVHYTIAATGTQRLDEVKATGGAVRITRALETLAGKPLNGAVKVGQVVAVRLQVELDAPQSYLIVEDRRPAGCEFADERLVGPAASHVEFRDDRVCAFFTALPAGRHEFVYYLRAETAGTSHLLSGCVYPMYAEKTRGETAAARVEVVR